MTKLQAIWAKLKAEWKTFVLACSTVVVGGWQFAVDQGVGIPNLLGWVREEYRSGCIFVLGVLLLLLRKYTPVDVPAPAPTVEPETPVKAE